MPKRILLISPLYYPAHSPNVYRWDAIVRQWIRQGHQVHWLCCRHGKAPRQETVTQGFTIHRCGHYSLLDFLYDKFDFFNKRRGTIGAGTPTHTAFRKIAEKIVDLTWRQLYWPDGACLWYLPARQKALQLVKECRYDVVVSVSLPFTAVLIAHFLKKKFPGLFWLMDIEDPFSLVKEYFINNRRLFATLNERAEIKALQAADGVVVTTEAALIKYHQRFPFIKGKIFVIPPLFDPWPTAGIKPSIFHKKEEAIHLGYFGTFYHPIRSPEPLLWLLQKIFERHPAFFRKLQVHFAGEIPVEYSDIFQRYPVVQPLLHFYGLIPRTNVWQMMQEMDVLINIGNSTDYHLPSKSAEYLASQKPILNLMSTPKDTFASFSRNTEGIFHILTEKGKNLSEIEMDTLIRFLENPVQVNRQGLEVFFPAAISAQYGRIADLT